MSGKAMHKGQTKISKSLRAMSQTVSCSHAEPGESVMNAATRPKPSAHIERLIQRVNRKDWWHVPPVDPFSYSKRGKFLSSTYREAESYGRPSNTPERVTVRNPLIGDEKTIETVLLGKPVVRNPKAALATEQFAIDAKLYKAGRARGYDAIVLLSPANFDKFKTQGKIPLSIELNLLTGDWECEAKPPHRPKSSSKPVSR